MMIGRAAATGLPGCDERVRDDLLGCRLRVGGDQRDVMAAGRGGYRAGVADEDNATTVSVRHVPYHRQTTSVTCTVLVTP